MIDDAKRGSARRRGSVMSFRTAGAATAGAGRGSGGGVSRAIAMCGGVIGRTAFGCATTSTGAVTLETAALANTESTLGAGVTDGGASALNDATSRIGALAAGASGE